MNSTQLLQPVKQIEITTKTPVEPILKVENLKVHFPVKSGLCRGPRDM